MLFSYVSVLNFEYFERMLMMLFFLDERGRDDSLSVGFTNRPLHFSPTRHPPTTFFSGLFRAFSDRFQIEILLASLLLSPERAQERRSLN